MVDSIWWPLLTKFQVIFRKIAQKYALEDYVATDHDSVGKI